MLPDFTSALLGTLVSGLLCHCVLWRNCSGLFMGSSHSSGCLSIWISPGEMLIGLCINIVPSELYWVSCPCMPRFCLIKSVHRFWALWQPLWPVFYAHKCSYIQTAQICEMSTLTTLLWWPAQTLMRTGCDRYNILITATGPASIWDLLEGTGRCQRGTFTISEEEAEYSGHKNQLLLLSLSQFHRKTREIPPTNVKFLLVSW